MVTYSTCIRSFIWGGDGYARSRSVVLWWAGASLRRDLLHCTTDTLWGRWGLGKVTLPSLTKHGKGTRMCLVLMALCDLHLYAWSLLLKLSDFIFQCIRVTCCHVYFAESNRLHPGVECGSVFTLSVTEAHCWARSRPLPKLCTRQFVSLREEILTSYNIIIM